MARKRTLQVGTLALICTITLLLAVPVVVGAAGPYTTYLPLTFEQPDEDSPATPVPSDVAEEWLRRATPTPTPLPTAPLPAQAQWRKVTSPSLAQDWVRDISVNPSPPHEVLIAFRDAGIYKSEDGGQTWRSVYTGSARHIAHAPSNPNIVYATVMNNVLRSDDRGSTWKSILPREVIGGGWALAVDPLDANHVFIGINATTPYHVYETTDGGATWTASLSLADLEGIVSLAIDPQNRNIVWAGANTDVAAHPQITRLYKSVDGGTSWAMVQNGLPASKRLTSINFSVCQPGLILISRQKHGTVDSYIRRTTDSGATWQTVSLFDDDIGVSTVAPCPIYAGLRSSVDGGATWSDLTLNIHQVATGDLWFSAWEPDPWNNVLWLGTRYSGVFYLSGAVPAN